MIYVVGDVHGCLNDLKKLISEINSQDDNAELIFVGDFVDRGPMVVDTIDWFMKNVNNGGNYRTVKGNHEQMAIEWFDEVLELLEEGYDVDELPYADFDMKENLQKANLINPEYIIKVKQYMESLPLSIKVSVNDIDYEIVHAWSPEATKYTDLSEEDVYLWERNSAGNYLNDTIIIHGHTPTISFSEGGIQCALNDINVDGGCVYRAHGGKLCALCLNNLKEFYV